MIDLLKVEFDYESTNEEELTVKEDQLVWILENDDQEWFKVKLKSSEPELALIGLVPASYLTSPTLLRNVIALYSYEPTKNEEGELENEEELDITEGELLNLFEEEGDWFLVGRIDGKGVGFVPSTYVETAGEEGSAEPEEIYEEPVVLPTSKPYVEPSERVAATKPVVKVGEVKTWSVTEVDKKKKKKKGTLGIGNGAVFFASESDKTPVQQYPLSTLSDTTTEKSKHLHLTFPAGELHFVISSKDSFEEILIKLNSDKDLATSQARTSTPPTTATPRTVTFPAPPSSSSSAPSPSSSNSRAMLPPPLSDRPYIPPPPPVRTASYSATSPTSSTSNSKLPSSNGDAIALYDFNPQGEDELNISEGDRLFFIVDGSDDPDWVKVRKVGSLEEGVVPASYVERDEGTESTTVVSSNSNSNSKSNGGGGGRRNQPQTSEDEEEERLAASDALTLKAQLQADARAQKLSSERENQARKSRLSIAPPAVPIPLPTRIDVERDSRDTSSSSNGARRDSGKERSRDAPKKPATHRVRTWKDRTGQFKVDAEFLGLNGNKIRLHKLNGVIIEVPMEKMSSEDTAYLKRVTARSSSVDDDIPLAQIANQEDRRNERHKRGEAAAASAGNGNSKSSSGSTSDGRTRKSSKSSSSMHPPPSKKETDWFDFFLNAGCDMHDCTRYANNFDKERIEESLIVDIGSSTLRTLGLREGDIIRVLKYIKLKYEPPPTPEKSDRDARLAMDASIAKSLTSVPTPPAPNLFSGPDGALKTTRRGRPNRANSNMNPVDAASLASAGSELARKNSPANGLGLSNTPRVASPPATSTSLLDSIPRSTAPTSGGFDDDAWTVKGTSKVPAPVVTSTPLTEAPPSITPLQTPQRAGSAGATSSTLSYNDGLLAQLGITARPPSAPVGQSAFNPAQQLELLKLQQSAQQQQQQQQQAYSQPPPSFGPRLPVAPIAANQGLLAPLIPTVTGMPGGYNRSPFNPMMPQVTGFVPQQQIPMMTGYSGGMMGMQQQPQPMAMNQQFTGMPNRNGSPFANPLPPQLQQQQPSYLQSQPTGIPNFLQSQPTGYQPQQQYQQQQQQQQPVFNQTPAPLVQFNPLPPSQSSAPPASATSAQFTPSNVFASMKGTQDVNKYDALRPQPTGFQPQQQQQQMGMMQPQPTGFNGMPMNLQQQPLQGSIFPQQTGVFGQQPQQQQQQQPNGYSQQRQY